MDPQVDRPTKNPLRGHAGPPPEIIRTEDEPEREKNERMNIYLPESVANYMRDISFALGREYALGELVTQAMPALFAHLEETRNGGKQFAQRPSRYKNLPTGPAVQRDRSA